MMMKDQIPLVRELGKRQDPCLKVKEASLSRLPATERLDFAQRVRYLLLLHHHRRLFDLETDNTGSRRPTFLVVS